MNALGAVSNWIDTHITHEAFGDPEGGLDRVDNRSNESASVNELWAVVPGVQVIPGLYMLAKAATDAMDKADDFPVNSGIIAKNLKLGTLAIGSAAAVFGAGTLGLWALPVVIANAVIQGRATWVDHEQWNA